MWAEQGEKDVDALRRWADSEKKNYWTRSKTCHKTGPSGRGVGWENALDKKRHTESGETRNGNSGGFLNLE